MKCETVICSNFTCLQIHPEGKVPAFVDTDKKVITESIDIANYLDEKYPEPQLYNENTKDRDLELLDQYSKVICLLSITTDKYNFLILKFSETVFQKIKN